MTWSLRKRRNPLKLIAAQENAQENKSARPVQARQPAFDRGRSAGGGARADDGPAEGLVVKEIETAGRVDP
jgi:hypothetical protein